MKALIFLNTAGDIERDKREAQAILAIKQRYGKMPYYGLTILKNILLQQKEMNR